MFNTTGPIGLENEPQVIIDGKVPFDRNQRTIARLFRAHRSYHLIVVRTLRMQCAHDTRACIMPMCVCVCVCVCSAIRWLARGTSTRGRVAARSTLARTRP